MPALLYVRAMKPWRRRLACQLLSTAVLTGLAAPVLAQNAATPPAAPAPPAETGTLDNFPANLTGFTYTGSLDVSGTVSSNGRGLPRSAANTLGKRGPDENLTGRFDLTLHDHTARFSGDLDYALSAYAYARRSQRDHIGHDLSALAKAELVPEHLELQARVFARQIYANLLGAIGAGNRPVSSGPNSGLRQSLGYTIAPDFRFRLANFATSETTVDDSGIFFFRPHNQDNSATVPGEDIPNSTNSYGATEKISSGTDFTRLSWSLAASGRQTARRAGDYSQVSEIAELKYAVSHEFIVLGDVGYEGIASEQRLTRDLRGLIAMGGFQYSPSPDFQLSARAGRQFNFPSYIGSLSYQITPLTSLAGSLTDSVKTPAERMLDSLNSLGVNGNGQFVNTDFGTSGLDLFDPSPLDGLGISNEISRYRSASLSFEHNDGRTHYRLTGFGTVRDRLTVSNSGTPPRQESYGGSVAITRNFTPVVNGTLQADYIIHNVLGGRLNLIRTSFEMDYDATQNAHIYMRAAYLHRLSSSALTQVSPLSASLTDIVATVGLRQDIF